MDMMTGHKTVHECLFCPQIFGSAAEKDDHILGHFAQETCGDCNQNLIRIGDTLYTVHNSTTCINRETKSEEQIEPCFADTVIAASIADDETQVKIESVSTDFNQRVPLNKFASIEIPSLAPIRVMPPLVPIEAVHCSGQPVLSLNSAHLEEVVVKEEPVIQNEYEQEHFAQAIEEPLQEEQSQPSTESSIRKRGPHICNICGHTYARNDSLRAHKIRMHSAPGTQFCHICCRLFEKEIESKKHLAICKSKRLQRHEARKCKDENTSYQCYLCLKQSPNQSALSAHIRLAHTNQNKFKCSTCGLRLFSKQQLEAHQQRRHVRKLEKFACNVCGKLLSTRKSLKSHMARHNDQNPIKCLIEGCNEFFLIAGDRDEHMQTHTSQTGEPAMELQEETGWSSDEEQPEDNRSVVIESICVNELQIKAEPDQSQVRYEEMASACNLKPRADDLGTIDSSVVTNAQTNVHFASEFGSTRIETTEHNTTIPSASSSNPPTQRNRKKRKSVECDICGKTLSVQSSLERHKVLLHSAPGTHFCKLCAKIFGTAEEVAAHLSECLRKKTGGSFNCNICNKTLYSRRSFRTHMQLKHNPNDKFKCKLCGAHFATKTGLANHTAFHDKGAQLPCDICGRIYSRLDTLKGHKIRMHSKPGTYFCSICCRVFTNEKEVTEHKLDCVSKRKVQQETRKSKDKNATYECYLCRTTYPTQTAVRGHYRFKHSSDAIKFKCIICGKGFSTQFALDNHIKSHNTPLNDRKFMCTVCGKYLATSDSFRNHMYIHTEEKPFKCSFEGCDKHFRSKVNVTEHMRSHTGEKPRKCEIDGCDKRFAYGVDLRRHKFKVHGIFRKKFPCTICSDIFPENNLLKAHMTKHHAQLE